MAIGDAAAAAGLAVVPPTEDVRKGYERINQRGDELAAHLTAGTHTWNQITGKPVTSPWSSGYIPTTGSNVQADLDYLGGRIDGLRADNIQRPAGYGTIEAGLIATAGTANTANSNATHAYNTAVTANNNANGRALIYAGNPNAVQYAQASLTPGVTRTNRAVWQDAAGNFGQNTSSRRYKAEIRAADVDTKSVLELEPVTFRYRANVTEDQSRQLGLIAEDVPESLAETLVILDGEGRPDGVRYESVLPVLLLSVVKDLAARVAELEGKTDAA